MNSANYSPQEMWNSGCQLGEWGPHEREQAGCLSVGEASAVRAHTAFQTVETRILLIIFKVASNVGGKIKSGSLILDSVQVSHFYDGRN